MVARSAISPVEVLEYTSIFLLLPHLDLQAEAADAGVRVLDLENDAAVLGMATKAKRPNKDGAPALYHWNRKWLNYKPS